MPWTIANSGSLRHISIDVECCRAQFFKNSGKVIVISKCAIYLFFQLHFPHDVAEETISEECSDAVDENIYKEVKVGKCFLLCKIN